MMYSTAQAYPVNGETERDESIYFPRGMFGMFGVLAGKRLPRRCVPSDVVSFYPQGWCLALQSDVLRTDESTCQDFFFSGIAFPLLCKQ